MRMPKRDSNGALPPYAWPGGYPIFYLAADNGVLCPKCANSYAAGIDTEEQLMPIAAGINWEDETMCCENCSVWIEAAYGGTTSAHSN